jgi:hypothetical protein
MGNFEFVLLLLVLLYVVSTTQKLGRSTDKQFENLRKKLKEETDNLKESIEDLKSQVERLDSYTPPYRERQMIPDPGGVYSPSIARNEDLEHAVQEAISEIGATSGRQMGMVIKAARGKLRGKQFKEEDLDTLVHDRLNGNQ